MVKLLISCFFIVLLSFADGNASLTLNKAKFQQLLQDGNITDVDATETKKRSSLKLVIEEITVSSVDWNDSDVESFDNVFKVTVDGIEGKVEAQYQAEKKMKMLGRWRRVWKSDRNIEAKFSDAKVELVAAMSETGVKVVSCQSSIPNFTVTMPRGKSLLEKAKKLFYKPLLKKIKTPLNDAITKKLCPTLGEAISTETFVVVEQIPDDENNLDATFN